MQALCARAMREMLLLASLALLSTAACSVDWYSDYEYVWSSQGYGQSHCVEIPEELRLCHGVGYTQMQLPNLLEHESMAEMKQQASIWVPHVNKKCHSGTQIFLCTLLAPVCFEKLIRPCRMFCEAVRNSCSPVMDKDKELCINYNYTGTLEASAIKTKIKEAKTENEDKVVTLQKKRLMRFGALNNEQLKKLGLYLRNGGHCSCQQLENMMTSYLIMGRRVGAHYLLTGIHQWDEQKKEHWKLLKYIKTYKCPALYSVFKQPNCQKSGAHYNTPVVFMP